MKLSKQVINTDGGVFIVSTFPQQSYPNQPPVYPVQPPVQPYLQQTYPGQPYAQPVYPAPYPAKPQKTQQEQQKFNDKRSLRHSANSLGTLMLIFFGLEIAVSVVLVAIFGLWNNVSALTENEELYMLENGLISMLVFFAAGLVYCLIRKLSFRDIFPFEKIKPSFLFQLCTIGISFSLMSNYVVSMLDNTFSLFGIENKGGTIDAGSEPNILLYVLMVAIMPALVEEFAFRGVIMGVLKPYSPALAILVSSGLFALMHGNFVQMPFTFCCGIVFAYMDIKTNSLLPSIIVHFLNNGLSVLSDILTSYHIIDDQGANTMYGVIFFVTGILSLIFLKRIISKDGNKVFTLEQGGTVLTYKEKVKTVTTSPTIIIFAAIMTAYSAFSLFTG